MPLSCCEVLAADAVSFAAIHSATLHCIPLRHAGLNVCLAFAAYSAAMHARLGRGEDACMHAVGQSVDPADRGVDSPVSLGRDGAMINAFC